MASAHHHHHGCCSPSCCCCCRSSYGTTGSVAPPLAVSSDPLLQAVATQLLHLQILQQQRPHHDPHNHPVPKCQGHHSHPQPFHTNRRRRNDEAPTPGTGLHSLIRRVAALESSLPDLSPPPGSRPRPSPVRDNAARVIQRQFRIFLVRRSQALRALKRLSSVRSGLRSPSLLGSDRRSACRRAAELLAQLDSVQSGDLTVCREKMSISREIAAIVDALERTSQKPEAESVGAVAADDADEGSWRMSSEGGEQERFSCGEEEEEEEVRNDRKGARPLGLDAPLPVKMESRKAVAFGTATDYY